jgi:uncharacterized protein YprB with RNaseH-like and TPR domain/predicted nuclease with RNAse H fold/dephospho-CoA kinase
MLNATFQRILRGISAHREIELWNRGFLSWDDFEKAEVLQTSLFSNLDQGEESGVFARARRALKASDAGYFADLLDRREHYRILLSFPEKVIFLDIETTGLSRYYDTITLIGWHYRGEYNVFTQGDDETPLREALADACTVVTFNGSLFDLPFLRQSFINLPLPPVHVDLRFLAKRADLAGGQKLIEEEVGFRRPVRLSGIKGEAAPILWHQYRRGNIDSLKLLVEYNYYDIVGMKFILDKVVERLLRKNNVPSTIRKDIPQFFLRKEAGLPAAKKVHPMLISMSYRPYIGHSRPQITMSQLAVGRTRPFRVVGIDLTGSESRPSGWCLLDGAEAVTHIINNDDEIIAQTLATKPHLVSIDSPLSLPKGRQSVFDDDPGRKEHGIMRYCERLLKKRGINVYPALIPSMQRLTARGIRLASSLRRMGVPVIESYPGAAQDIMGIPRKRASLDMLREGLAEFGITGPFLGKPVSHDELDAITSAAIGVFFWSGKFEALGCDEEEALIIPDLHIDAKSWQERVVIGISGHIAAGKTTVARFFESNGFHYTRYSMVLAALMQSQGKEISRPALQHFGDAIYNERGQRWLGRKLMDTLPKKGNIVIDGLRFADDYAFLIEMFGPAFRHVHVETSEQIRKTRFEMREAGGMSFQEAELHPVEQHIQVLRTLAHEVITNNGTVQDLYSHIAGLLPFPYEAVEV